MEEVHSDDLIYIKENDRKYLFIIRKQFKRQPYSTFLKTKLHLVLYSI